MFFALPVVGLLGEGIRGAAPKLSGAGGPGTDGDMTDQPSLDYPTFGRIIREDARIDRLLPPGARIEVLASGFAWSEGPVWIPDGGYLLFSDIPRNRILRWKEGEGITVWMQPSGYTGVVEYGPEPGSNGLTLDPSGRLLCRIRTSTKGAGW